MTDKLAGRVALVTGAAQGLGLAIARAFHEQGASVLLTDVNRAVRDVATQLDAGAGRSRGAVQDVRDEALWQELTAGLVRDRGSLDILVNNAALTISKPLWDIPAAEWDDVMAVNLRGTFFGCRAAGRIMREAGRGRIINISSLAGQRGGVVAGGHYSASKAGIVVLSKCFAAELAASNVTVNTIAPAAIEGPITRVMPADKVAAMAKTIPVGRLGDDREVGAAAVWLASDEAAFVTGATIDVNGGINMR